MNPRLKEEVNEAITLALGRGEFPYPQWDPERSLRAGISEEATKWAIKIIEESLQLIIDWPVTSLSQAGYIVEREMASRYLLLSEEAVEALA